MENVQQAPKEANADRMKRMPKVLIAYAKDIRKSVPLDSAADECLVFSAHTIEALLHINSCLRATLKEVSGCHKEHGTEKLCEGCLISIGNALAE